MLKNKTLLNMNVAKRYWTWMLQNAVTPLIRSVKILHVLPHCIIPGSVNVPMFYCDKPWISWRNPGLAVTSEHSDYMTPRFTLTRSVTAPSHGRWIVIDVDNSFRERRPAVPSVFSVYVFSCIYYSYAVMCLNRKTSQTLSDAKPNPISAYLLFC